MHASRLGKPGASCVEKVDGVEDGEKGDEEGEVEGEGAKARCELRREREKAVIVQGTMRLERSERGWPIVDISQLHVPRVSMLFSILLSCFQKFLSIGKEKTLTLGYR